MIKTLKKKFIFTAMIAVSVLLSVLLGAVNAVNAWSARKDAQRLLTSLVQMEAGSRRDQRRPGQEGWESGQGRTREDYGAPGSPDAPADREQPPELPFGEGPEGRGGFLSGDLTDNDRLSAVYFTVRLKDGTVTEVDVSRISTADEEKARTMMQTVLAKGSQAGTIESYRYASAPGSEGETVYVFLEDSARSNAVLRVAVLSALAGLGSWLLMLLLVVLLSKKAIAPIAANMERQRQFVTDAGHELKTPLAIIQANTEAMEMISGENKWSRNIKAQVARLTDLTGNLLTLARAEEAPAAGTFAEVDFSALTEQTAQMFLPPMERRGVKLKASVELGLRLQGSRTRLTSLLSALLDNAVKYAAENSEIRLELCRADKSLRLRLENICAALPDCPPDRLFDRFYRADTARTQSSGGFGIGLSAARVIAAQHGGELTAAYGDANRIVFTLSLPAE